MSVTSESVCGTGERGEIQGCVGCGMGVRGVGGGWPWL